MIINIRQDSLPSIVLKVSEGVDTGIQINLTSEGSSRGCAYCDIDFVIL